MNALLFIAGWKDGYQRIYGQIKLLHSQDAYWLLAIDTLKTPDSPRGSVGGWLHAVRHYIVKRTPQRGRDAVLMKRMATRRQDGDFGLARVKRLVAYGATWCILVHGRISVVICS